MSRSEQQNRATSEHGYTLNPAAAPLETALVLNSWEIRLKPRFLWFPWHKHICTHSPERSAVFAHSPFFTIINRMDRNDSVCCVSARMESGLCCSFLLASTSWSTLALLISRCTGFVLCSAKWTLWSDSRSAPFSLVLAHRPPAIVSVWFSGEHWVLTQFDPPGLNDVCCSSSPRFQGDICRRFIDRGRKRGLRRTYRQHVKWPCPLIWHLKKSSFI